MRLPNSPGVTYFARDTVRKIRRTSGPAKKICQQSAIGKLRTVVWNHSAIISLPGFWKRMVATRLIIGHIRQTIMLEIASRIKIGLSSGETRRKASIFARRSTTNISSTKQPAT